MDTNSQQPKGQDGPFSKLGAAIEAMHLAEKISKITPAKAVFSSVSLLLTMIRDSMTNELDYIELGLSCADVCRALDRGMNGRRSDELSEPVLEAIEQLTATVAEIKGKIEKRDKRNSASRLFHTKNDKESIVAWREDLNRLLRVFNTELIINTNMMVADIHRSTLIGQGGTDGQGHSTRASIPPGELPPPPLKACVGREELIDEIVGHVGNLTSIALIGAGGIGKTSIALAALHDDRIKARFGVNRRFIRCDQFPASLAHFLRRLSEVIGAGIENPEDLTPLRPFLSSREMVLFLDNAESILDPQGTDAQKIRIVVVELSRFSNLCLGITSRIRTVPPHCKRLIIPTLSMESACDIFYGIYDNDGRSDIIKDLVGRLDFHALSITLLATVASDNMWDYDRLASEWDAHQTQVLRTDYDESLAATIELSLASPTFRNLGPDARDLLGVIAFFPQGIDEDIDWLFPTIPDRKNIFDKFCLLSLTYRSNGFVTMLAPLRDYLSPKVPEFSPLLHTTKGHYLHKLSLKIDPDKPGFEETRWIMSEDANVEHLLDVFTSVDANSDGVWLACADFMGYLGWHKPRLVVLGPKIEGLLDNHPSKPKCLLRLSVSFYLVGNFADSRRLRIWTLELSREREDGLQVAQVLVSLSDTNRQLGLFEEGISQAEEALGVYERHNHISGQARSLKSLAWLLNDNQQPDAAETAASKAIDLFSKVNNRLGICQCHHALGDIYGSRGETEKAINHFEAALEIASSSGQDYELFYIRHCLTCLLLIEDRFSDARVHIEHARSHAVNDPYCQGRVMMIQAWAWCGESRFKEAKSEILCAADVFKRIGAARDLERSRTLLQHIEEMEKPATFSG